MLNLLRVHAAGLIVREERQSDLAWLGGFNSGVSLAGSAFRELHRYCSSNNHSASSSAGGGGGGGSSSGRSIVAGIGLVVQWSN